MTIPPSPYINSREVSFLICQNFFHVGIRKSRILAFRIISAIPIPPGSHRVNEKKFDNYSAIYPRRQSMELNLSRGGQKQSRKQSRKT